jgi:hypothetical protein
MTTPTGKLSVKARSVTPPPTALLMVNVRVAVLPGPMVDGLKALVKVGWA